MFPYRYLLLTLVCSSMSFASCGNQSGSPAGMPVPGQANAKGAHSADTLIVDSQPVPQTTVQPQYPDIARKAGVEGSVWVQVLVTENGLVKDLKILRATSTAKNDEALKMLKNAASDAARKWTFTPAMLNGKPVAVWVAIPFNFKLDHKKK
jgi:periplasmic protein TonB